MSDFLSRAVAFLVAPAEPAAFAPPRPRGAVVGVLATDADVLVAGGLVAAGLRRDARAAAVLVCVWRGPGDPSPPAPAIGSPAAARMASELGRRGLSARASGALCVAELPADPGAAAAAFRDAAAAVEVPAVLAVTRREPALDPLLARAGRLVLALSEDADPVLAALALAGLGSLGPPADRATLPAGSLARHAARLGLGARASAPDTVRDALPVLQNGLSR